MKTLYRYECRNCKTWAVTADDMGRAVRCNGCKGYKVFRFPTEAEGDQDERDWHLAKERGVLHLPIPQEFGTCKRCGETVEMRQTRYSTGGLVCLECYRAEEHPPVRLLTPEEVKAVEAARRKATKDYENHHQFGSTGE